MTRTRLAIWFALGIALSLSGCAKTQEKAPRIEGIPEAEVARAKKACDMYVARVCSCAEQHADMAETCALAKASPDALQINLDLLASTGLEIAEQKAVKVEARKIAAACFSSESKLDEQKCPRHIP